MAWFVAVPCFSWESVGGGGKPHKSELPQVQIQAGFRTDVRTLNTHFEWIYISSPSTPLRLLYIYTSLTHVARYQPMRALLGCYLVEYAYLVLVKSLNPQRKSGRTVGQKPSSANAGALTGKIRRVCGQLEKSSLFFFSSDRK